MQVIFYVLGERYAPNSATVNTASDIDLPKSEAVLQFVCKLIQTVVKKSEHSLIVIDDQPERLQLLDTQLWSFETTSFIPHQLILEATPNTALLSAPVTLLSQMPEAFDGVALNLAAAPLPLNRQAPNTQKITVLPERVLEIISPDEISKEQGRQKYRVYRDFGFDLAHHKIS